MKIEFTRDQLVAIASGLTADELARQFHQFTDSLTLAEWSAETKLGEGGLELTPAQQQACRARFFHFFGHDDVVGKESQSACFGDWADQIAPHLTSPLKIVYFPPSADSETPAISHPAEALIQDAEAMANLVRGCRRVIAMVAPHSLFGFATTVLAPSLLKLETVDARPLSVEQLEETIAPGDLIVATPTLWRFLLQSVPNFPTNMFGLSFGEPLSGALYTSLRERGLSALREIYGSTENGIIGWRESPSEKFVPFGHWQRDGEDLIRLGEAGEKISVKPMDRLVWSGERAFSLEGRRDGAIQIGAVNVYPDMIAKKIADHPDIKECQVSVSRHGVAMDRLVAKILLRKGLLPDQTMAWKVDAWCRKKLRPPERPRIYTFVTELSN